MKETIEKIVNAWWEDQAEPGSTTSVKDFKNKLDQLLPNHFFIYNGLEWVLNGVL